MSDRGIGSANWMAKAVILNAHPVALRKAVIDLVDWVAELKDGSAFTSFELMDRLVQVAALGEYKPPVEDTEDSYSVSLSDADVDEEVAKFRDFIEGLQDGEEPEGY